MHQSGPSEDPVLVSDPILRPRERDGLDYATILKYHLRDVKDLAREGLIVANEVEPDHPGETNLGIALAGIGDPHIDVPTTILKWSTHQGSHAQQLLIQAVRRVAQEPQRDAYGYRLIYSLWNVYQTIQTRYLNLYPPKYFCPVLRVEYAKLLLSYAG